MSHFITLVFTKENEESVESLLEPFNENKECLPYVKYTKRQAIAEIRKEIEDFKNGAYARYLADPKAYEENCRNAGHINYIKNEFPKELHYTDEECYTEMKLRFEEDMVCENGDLLSTYNPNSKWDWYDIGGRWNKYLKTKNGRQVNTAYVDEIDWKDIFPFAFITPDGEWHERGEMGWWACVSNEKEETDWKDEFKKFICSLDSKNTIVTVVDCHI